MYIIIFGMRKNPFVIYTVVDYGTGYTHFTKTGSCIHLTAGSEMKFKWRFAGEPMMAQNYVLAGVIHIMRHQHHHQLLGVKYCLD